MYFYTSVIEWSLTNGLLHIIVSYDPDSGLYRLLDFLKSLSFGGRYNADIFRVPPGACCGQIDSFKYACEIICNHGSNQNFKKSKISSSFKSRATSQSGSPTTFV